MRRGGNGGGRACCVATLSGWGRGVRGDGANSYLGSGFQAVDSGFDEGFSFPQGNAFEDGSDLSYGVRGWPSDSFQTVSQGFSLI